jgi:DGQHR domain-containing protein
MFDPVLPKSECPKVVTIRFPLTYNTCRIIDGQHRLLGFSVLSNEIQKNHYLPVIALQKYDRMKEIQTFVDINSKQQKIDRNLILLLKSTLDFEIGSKEYKEKIAVKAAEELSSFFKGRLYRGAADEVKGDKITLTTMVSGMMKNNQIYDTVEDTTKKLREYFNYVQKFIPEQSFQSGAYFGSNIGISVLFRLINLLQRNFDANRIQISKEEFFQDMNSILSKDLVRRLSLYLGDAGSKIASDIVITELRKKFPTKYGKMASNLTYLRKPKSKKI